MVEGDRLRGIYMDYGEGVRLRSVQGAISRDTCEFCVTVDGAIDGVVMMRGFDLEGVLVVPEPHVAGLEDLSVPHRANVFAAVQRATRMVCDGMPCSAPRIVVLTDRPGSMGHIGIHVLLGRSDDAAHAVPRVHRGDSAVQLN